MKIAFLPHHFPPRKGGISTWMYSICHSLQRDDIYVLTEDSEARSAFDQKQHFQIFRYTGVKNTSILTFFSSLYRVFKHTIKTKSGRKISNKSILNCVKLLNHKQFDYSINTLKAWFTFFQNQKIDIIYCGFAIPQGIAAMILKYFLGIPYGVFVHGLEIQSSKTSNNENKLLKLILEKADIVIANSRFTRNLATSEFKNVQDKIEILHPGVNDTLLSQNPTPLLLKKKLGLKKHKVLLTVANLVERKGHDKVIKALPEVLKHVLNVKYLIIGQGEFKENLELLIEQLHLKTHISFLGTIPDSEIASYYALCDVFIMPSRQEGIHVEGFGISYIEASALGKPVIGGKSGGTADAIIDGSTGLLVNSEDENEIANALIRLLTNEKLAKQLGDNGKRRIKDELTWSKER